MSSTEREGVGGIENTILNLVFFKKIPPRGLRGILGRRGVGVVGYVFYQKGE